MPLHVEAIGAHQFTELEGILSDAECMRYALSLGVGRDPMDRDELRFVFEEDLQVFPTMPVILGHPGLWMSDPALRITRQMLVHGTQRLQIHQPLLVNQPFIARNQVLELVDKGVEGGALIVVERTLRDKATQAQLATMESGVFCRADGGFGGQRSPSHEFRAVPNRGANITCEMPTNPNQALWYRLNGDRNPLHASPTFAEKAGFPRPILHGLCTFGIAAHALMRHAGEDGMLRNIETRFSKPVFPGETIRFEMWRQPEGIAFRAFIDARDAVVLDRGFATFSR